MPARTLANGDLWLPPHMREPAADNVGTQAADALPEDRVQAAVVEAKDPLRPSMVCPWCGQEAGTEEAFRGHVVQYHGRQIGEASVDAREAEQSMAARAAAQRAAAP